MEQRLVSKASSDDSTEISLNAFLSLCCDKYRNGALRNRCRHKHKVLLLSSHASPGDASTTSDVTVRPTSSLLLEEEEDTHHHHHSNNSISSRRLLRHDLRCSGGIGRRIGEWCVFESSKSHIAQMDCSANSININNHNNNNNTIAMKSIINKAAEQSSPHKALSCAEVIPPSRFGHTAVLYQGREMVVFGGKNNLTYLDDVYSLDLQSGKWTQHEPPREAISPQPQGQGQVRRWPVPRCGHSAVMHGHYMYVVSGGISDRNDCADDMWCYSLPRRCWVQSFRALPFSPRKGHTTHLLPAADAAGSFLGDVLVTFGGLVRLSRRRPRLGDPEWPAHAVHPSATSVFSNDVLLFDLQRRCWSLLQVCGDVPCPRSYHVSQLIEGTATLLVFGGRTEPRVQITPSAGELEAATAAENAGMTDGVINDFFRLDITSGIWREVQAARGPQPSPRMCCASIYANGIFAVFAGGGKRFSEESYEFDVEKCEWRQLQLQNEPRCSRPTVVYTGDRIVLYGGCGHNHAILGEAPVELQLSPLTALHRCQQLLLLRERHMQATAGSCHCRPKTPTTLLLPWGCSSPHQCMSYRPLYCDVFTSAGAGRTAALSSPTHYTTPHVHTFASSSNNNYLGVPRQQQQQQGTTIQGNTDGVSSSTPESRPSTATSMAARGYRWSPPAPLSYINGYHRASRHAASPDGEREPAAFPSHPPSPVYAVASRIASKRATPQSSKPPSPAPAPLPGPAATSASAAILEEAHYAAQLARLQGGSGHFLLRQLGERDRGVQAFLSGT